MTRVIKPPSKRLAMIKRKFLAIFIFVGILLGIFACALWHPNEPRYENKSVTTWLDEWNLGLSFDCARLDGAAERAIKAMGAKAEPYIITRMRSSDSFWRRNYRNLFSSLPPWLQKPAPLPAQEFTDITGSAALLAIGSSALPTLIRGLRDGHSKVRSACALALLPLAYLQSIDIKESLPGLTACLRDPEARVRWSAALALGGLGPDAAAAIPGLVPLLLDAQEGDRKRWYSSVRSAAALTLGIIGPQAKRALPALRSLLNDPSPYDSSTAALAVWRINAEVTNTLPVLLRVLAVTPDASKWRLLEGLEEMGPRARDALPALLRLLPGEGEQYDDSARIFFGLTNVPSRFTLEKLTNALLRIDPDAARHAGVQLPAAASPR